MLYEQVYLSEKLKRKSQLMLSVMVNIFLPAFGLGCFLRFCIANKLVKKCMIHMSQLLRFGCLTGIYC